MSQNGQTHFENYARNLVKSPNVSGVFRKLCINPIQNEPFLGLFLNEGVGGGGAVALPKICHTNSTMMNLSYFHRETINFTITRNTDWVFKDYFNYDVITSVHDVTNKILSCDSNYIVDVFMWPKVGNARISMREIILTSIL